MLMLKKNPDNRTHFHPLLRLTTQLQLLAQPITHMRTHISSIVLYPPNQSFSCLTATCSLQTLFLSFFFLSLFFLFSTGKKLTV